MIRSRPTKLPPAPLYQERDGEARKDQGMAIAASNKRQMILAGELALLNALLDADDHRATTDAATTRQDEKYPDGGKWRGSITRRLASAGLIHKVGVTQSTRAYRNRGYLSVWEAVDLERITERCEELRRLLGYDRMAPSVSP